MGSLENVLLYILLGVMIFDIITGVAKSIVWKVTDSSTGVKGLIKHSIIAWMFVLMYFGSALLDQTIIVEFIDVNNFINVLAIVYIFNYLLSIFENFGVMGIFYPTFLKTRVEEEKRKYEDKLKNISKFE